MFKSLTARSSFGNGLGSHLGVPICSGVGNSLQAHQSAL
jgi:hypothetical protein